MHTVLERMGVGGIFWQWVKIIYTNPTARVRVNNILSESFGLERGTTQGCPLSLLLFALVVEPLACMLRHAHHQRGIRLGRLDILLSLYADDIPLLVRDPESNLDPLIRDIILYGNRSSLKIN